jgi:RNase P subunit RPR2
MTEYTNEIKEIRCENCNRKLATIENNCFIIKGKTNYYSNGIESTIICSNCNSKNKFKIK